MVDEATIQSFHEAVRVGSVDEVRAVLENCGAALSESRVCGSTALHTAAHYGHFEIVKLLLAKEYGFDVNAGEEFSPHVQPLQMSLRRGAPELVRLLLEHGADPNHDRTVLSAVTGFPDQKQHAVAILKLLEEFGADLHRTFVNYQSPKQEMMNALSAAIAFGQNDAAEFLRSRGVTLPPGAFTSLAHAKRRWWFW